METTFFLFVGKSGNLSFAFSVYLDKVIRFLTVPSGPSPIRPGTPCVPLRKDTSMIRRALSLLLSLWALCALLIPAGLAATLQSNQAVYHISQDPAGSESFSYSATQSHVLTLLPSGTVVRSDLGYQLIVERFTYRTSWGYWAMDTSQSSQEHLTVRDHSYIYHIATQDPRSGQPMDRGVWVRAVGVSGVSASTVTGEPVDEWAVDQVNEAIALNLMPAHLRGRDLRQPITRLQFAALAVRLYEVMGGAAVSAPGSTPFADTSDPEVGKAWALGITAGTSATTFSPSQAISREQAAVMLSAVYRRLGGQVSGQGAAFADDGSISPWAKSSVYFMARHGIVAGTGGNCFSPQRSAQRQSCLIMALGMFQKLSYTL